MQPAQNLGRGPRRPAGTARPQRSHGTLRGRTRGAWPRHAAQTLGTGPRRPTGDGRPHQAQTIDVGRRRSHAAQSHWSRRAGVKSASQRVQLRRGVCFWVCFGPTIYKLR